MRLPLPTAKGWVCLLIGVLVATNILAMRWRVTLAVGTLVALALHKRVLQPVLVEREQGRTELVQWFRSQDSAESLRALEVERQRLVKQTATALTKIRANTPSPPPPPTTDRDDDNT